VSPRAARRIGLKVDFECGATAEVAVVYEKQIVIVYLIFGALMGHAGAGKWFMDLSLALTGWSRGGPAKAAVVASAMFGSISGSPSGNAATTGVFTIPMMKSIGYSATFAAAVEAVASTGGMILPPVMAAIAFLMATWIEVPYTEVVYAAALPAALYFLIVFISVWGLASFYNAADMYRGLRDLWHCWEQDLGDGQGSDATGSCRVHRTVRLRPEFGAVARRRYGCYR